MDITSTDNSEKHLFLHGEKEEKFNDLSDIQEEEQVHREDITTFQNREAADERIRRLKSSRSLV